MISTIPAHILKICPIIQHLIAKPCKITINKIK